MLRSAVMMSLTRWSTIKMYSTGVYDVWYACPYCGYESWARAHGVGEGIDTGLHDSASALHAQHQSKIMAEHAASRAVHGSPCPRCSQHHPDVVRWAAQADREERRREMTRTVARHLRWWSVVGAVAFMATLVTRQPFQTWFVVGIMAAFPFLVGRALLATSQPLHGRWKLYKQKAPGVTFLEDATPK